jgi:type II secretion system protein J
MKIEIQMAKSELPPAPSAGGRGGAFGLATDRGPGRSAFTLLELLLAVLIFSIVLSAIHVVFFTALRLRDRTTSAVERSLPLQQTLNIIQRDLANLAAPGGTLSGQLQSTPPTSLTTSGLGPQNGPQFYTTVGLVNDRVPWSEFQRVSYFLAAPTNDAPGMDLFRSVARNLLPQKAEATEDQFLMSGVETVTFQYYDGSNWKDTWDSTEADTVTGLTNNLPKAIKVALALHAEDSSLGSPAPVELIVPVSVLQRTNFVTSVGGAE